MSSSIIELKNLNKDFVDNTGFKVHLLENLSVEIKVGVITSILAPKGSGKSSLLKIISGLEEAGENDLIKKPDKIFYLPSKPSSFPWLNVIDNVKYSLDRIDDVLIKDVISFVGLDGYEDHYAHNASLGFRFRISLARALVRKPDLLVIDETFNDMEPKTREEIYGLVFKTNREKSLSILIGTSNISEAALLSDSIILMDKNPGRITEVLESTLPKDRSANIFEEKDFIEFREQIENKIADISKEKFINYSF